MLIKPNTMTTETDLSRVGIKDKTRRMLIFVDDLEIQKRKSNPSHIIECKAFMINTCIADRNNKLHFIGSIDRSSEIDINTYTFDVSFYKELDNYNAAHFTLSAAYNSYIINDHSKDVSKFDQLSLYSFEMVGETDMIFDDFGNSMPMDKTISQLYHSNARDVPDPRYFNANHAFVNEVESILGDHIKNYIGNELIDDNTHVSFHDIKLYETLVSRINQNRMVEEMSNSHYQDPTSIVRDLFGDFSSSGAYGMLYNYDSLRKDKSGKDGVALVDYDEKSTIIPYGKYRSDRSMAMKFENQRYLFERKCKDLEAKFGPIKLFYTNKLTGDEARIHVYDNNEDHQISNIKVDCETHVDQFLDEYRGMILESEMDDYEDLTFL